VPSGFSAIKVGKLVWLGVGLVLASIACLLVNFLLFPDSTSMFAALLPVVMLFSGLFLLRVSFLFRLLKAMLRR